MLRVMATTFIYGLYDRNHPDKIVYVGKAGDPLRRLRQHRRQPCSRRLGAWLTKVGNDVCFTILAQTDSENWQGVEAFWVAALPNLLNVLPGGVNHYTGRVGRYARDLTGRRVGRWLVLQRVNRKGPNAIWMCRCDCGGLRELASYDLSHNRTSSCGCAQLRPKPPKAPRPPKLSAEEALRRKRVCGLRRYYQLKGNVPKETLERRRAFDRARSAGRKSYQADYRLARDLGIPVADVSISRRLPEHF